MFYGIQNSFTFLIVCAGAYVCCASLHISSSPELGGIGSRVRTRKGGLYTLPIWQDAKGPLVE